MPIAPILILIIGLFPVLTLQAQDQDDPVINAQHKSIVGIVSTTGSPLRVRKSQNTQAEVIAKLENGAPVRVLSVDNTWYTVQLEDGRKGYAFGKYIKMEDEYGVVATTENTSLNVKESDHKGSSTIATLENGAQVQILAETSNGWYQIRSESGTEGYVDRKHIKKQATPDSSKRSLSTETREISTTRSARVVTNGGALQIRTEPNGKIITSVENQSIVEVIKSQGDWYYVRLPDETTGFAYSQYLVLLEDALEDAENNIGYATVVTKSQPLNVRESPQIGAKVVSAVAKGQKVEVLEIMGNWYKIRTADDIEGYASAHYLSYVPN